MISRQVLFGIIVGILLARISYHLAWIYAGGGHGTYLPAKLLFPYAMLLTETVAGRITTPLLVLGLVQFPIYGVAAGLAARRGRLVKVLASMAVLHDLASAFCLIARNNAFSR